MKFIELAQKRFSCRSYKQIPVEEEKLFQVLDAGRIAPSAVNIQPWHFIVLREFENRMKICSAYKREWIKQAPVILVICGDHSSSWKRGDGKDYCDVDIAIAVDHMTLQAVELGLGTCWVCNFDKYECSRILELSSNLEPIVIMPLGYPVDETSDRHHLRKAIQDVVHWEKL